MPVILAVLVRKHERCAFAAKLPAEQAFVNVAKLADFERRVVNGFDSRDELLLCAAAGRWLEKDKLAQHTGEVGVGDAPVFEKQGAGSIGSEKAAVVAGHVAGGVELLVLAVNQMEELEKSVIEIKECVIVEVRRLVPEWFNKALK